MNDSITLSARIDFWTHYRATRAGFARTWTNYLGWVFLVGMPALLVAVIILLWHEDISAPGRFGVPVWILPIVGLLLMAVFIPLAHMLNTFSYRRRNRSVGGVQTYVLTPEEYSQSGSVFDVKLKWEAFIKARETPRFFLLYVAPHWAHFIPKSAVRSSAEMSSIRSLIRQTLGANAHVYPEA